MELMSYWSYALINNRLGEIYFDRKSGQIIYEGHSYLGKNERFTLADVKAMQMDIPHTQLTYYNHTYRRK